MLLGVGTVFALSLGLALGCSAEKQTPPAAAAGDSQTKNMTVENTQMNDAFADLSPADRKLAETQKVCPVSNQALGSMGAPIKVTVEGQDVFVCCAGCVEKLEANFAEYVAKLGTKP
jgi:hypothetical protein